MSVKRPLCLYGGRIEEMRASDALPRCLRKGVTPFAHGVLVPMYVYPHTGTGWDSAWKSLWDGARRMSAAGVQTLVIANPASGPGASADIAYTRAIDRSLHSGCIVIGYVSTQYGGKSKAAVLADIDAWVSIYPKIDGFFVDEVATSDATGYYADIVNYARSRIVDAVVVGNPGVDVDRAVQELFDACCTYEGAGYPAVPAYDWQDSPIERLLNDAAIVRSASTLSHDALDTLTRWYRWVFVTASSSYATWDASAWDALVDFFAVPAMEVAYPKRTGTPKIAGDAGGTALGTLALTASRQYFIPFVVPRRVVLSGLRISVTTASAGQANLGIYTNSKSGSDDAPGGLFSAISALLDTGTAGDKTGSFASPVALLPGQIYWASLIASAAATIRALPVASVSPALGRAVNGTAVISHLHAVGVGATLPDPAPTALTNGTGSCPAIYLIEA